MLFDRFNEMIELITNKHGLDGIHVNSNFALLQTAATLILAEEIHKLSTTNVTLAQAQTDLATAISNISTVITQAVTDLTSDNPATVQSAANAIEAGAQELNTLAGNLQTADPQPVSVPAGSIAATGNAPAATK